MKFSFRLPMLALAGAALLAACSDNTPIQEGEYFGGMPVDTATVEPTANGGYRTISGDPLIVTDNGIEPESMLPYGGSEQGIRLAEDESLNYTAN